MLKVKWLKGKWTWSNYLSKIFILLDKQLKEYNCDYILYVTSSLYFLPSYGDNVIVVLLWDESNQIPWYFDKVFMVFKNYAPIRFNIFNIKPIPIWYAHDFEDHHKYKKMDDRKIDIFFSGQYSKHRKSFFCSINKLNLKKYWNVEILETSWFNKWLKHQEYNQKMINTKIALCPKWTNYESYRIYEAAKMWCIVVMCKQYDFWFRKWSPLFEIKDWKHIWNILDEIYKKDFDKLQQQTLEWYENTCSETAVANYMFSNISSIERNNVKNNFMDKICIYFIIIYEFIRYWFLDIIYKKIVKLIN
jgi:hypothetical protein